MPSSEYMQLVDEVDNAKQAIKLGESLSKLRQIPEFIEVFDEYLFKELVCNLVLDKTSNLDKVVQKRINTTLTGLSVIQNLLNEITLQATSASYTIKDIEKVLDEERHNNG